MMENRNLPTLPRGWVLTRVGDIAISMNPGFPSGKHNQNGNGVPHLRPMNISPMGEIDLKLVKYVQPEEHDVLRQGDILFNNTNSPEWLGKSAYVKHDTYWAYSNHMTRIRLPLEHVNPAWITYCFHNLFLEDYFKVNCVHHVNQASIGTGFLADKVVIPLPPLPEQRRIVAKIEELFTRLDAGVAGLKKIRVQLKRYRQAVLKHAFEGKLTAAWREVHKGESEPATALLERIKEERKKNAKGKFKELPPLDTSDLPELPKGWVWTRVGDISLDPQYGWTTSAVPAGSLHLLRTTDITSGSIDWNSVPFCKEEPPYKEKYLLENGDIVISRAGSVGYSNLIRNPKEAIFASYLIRFKPLIYEQYMAYFLKSPYYWESISEKSLGIAIPNVNASKLKQVVIPLPPLPEQHKIVDEIERHFSIADQIEKMIEQSLRQAERLRRSILKRAFEGRLVRQDPSDEPAEKLLARIKTEKAKREAEQKAPRGKKRVDTRQRSLR